MQTVFNGNFRYVVNLTYLSSLVYALTYVLICFLLFISNRIPLQKIQGWVGGGGGGGGKHCNEDINVEIEFPIHTSKTSLQTKFNKKENHQQKTESLNFT